MATSSPFRPALGIAGMKVAAAVVVLAAAVALPWATGSALVALGELLFAVSFLTAAAALPVLRAAAGKSGLLDRPGGRKDHVGLVPRVGGVAVLLSVALPAAAGLLLSSLGAGLPWPATLAVHLPGIASKAPELLGILAGSSILLVLGYLDDRRGLSPGTRLVVEVLCALLLLALGVRLTLYLPWPWLQALVLVVFVVFVTNAVNFIDNMNGLMGGAATITALHLLALAIATGQLFLAAILICLAGALLAFLWWNFPTARVFMGDAGTLSVGFLLAALTVAFTFEEGPPSVRPVVLPLLILALPLADGVTVVVSRLRRGVHPFTAGRDHLSHRLVERGWSPRKAVLVLWSLAALAGVPAYVSAGVSALIPAVLFGGVVLLAAALGILSPPNPAPQSRGRVPETAGDPRT